MASRATAAQTRRSQDLCEALGAMGYVWPGPDRAADWAARSIDCTHLVVRTWPHTGSRCDLRWGSHSS